MICTPHQILFGWSNGKNGMGGACSTYEGGELHRGFWWGNLWKREHLEDAGVDWRVI